MLNQKLTTITDSHTNESLTKNIFFEKFKKTDNIMLEHFSDRVNIKNFENTINLLYNIDNVRRDDDDVFRNTKLLENITKTTIADDAGDSDDTLLTQTESKSCASEIYDYNIISLQQQQPSAPLQMVVDDNNVKGQRYENGVKQCHGNIFDKQTATTTTTKIFETNKNINHSVCCCNIVSAGNGKCNQFIADGDVVIDGYRNSSGCDCISITMVKGNKLNSMENCENSGNFDKKFNENVKYVGGDDEEEEGDDANKWNIKLQTAKSGMCFAYCLLLSYALCIPYTYYVYFVYLF